MGTLEIIIIVRAVKVGGHCGNEIAAVLAPISLAHLDARDLGDGVPLVGGFEGAGEEVRFLKGLRRQFRINARTAEEQQLFHPRLARSVNEIGLDLQVFVKERSRLSIVRQDSADFRRSNKHVMGFGLRIKSPNLSASSSSVQRECGRSNLKNLGGSARAKGRSPPARDDPPQK